MARLKAAGVQFLVTSFEAYTTKTLTVSCSGRTQRKGGWFARFHGHQRVPPLGESNQSDTALFLTVGPTPADFAAIAGPGNVATQTHDA